MYSIHRDPVNIGTVSSPAGNLTVISFFSLKGCIFSNGSLKGIFFFFFGITPPIFTLPYWCRMWSDFSRECLCLCWGFLTSAILIYWPREFFVVGGCPLHCKMSSRFMDSAHEMPVVALPAPSVTTKNASENRQIPPLGSKLSAHWEPPVFVQRHT